MDIDLVYTWVDGSDPEWQKKKAKFQNKEVSENAVVKGRFFDNEELKYSLRSVELFANWVHHIYIITDNQTPKWLDTRNPEITIVDHKDIIPQKYLPIFNSPVIEWHIPFIKNLSEHFLLANDDMCFGRNCAPDFFFDRAGEPIEHVRFYKESDSPLTFHAKTIQNTVEIFKRKTGQNPVFKLEHVISPYRKSFFENVKNVFKDEIEAIYVNRFRKENNISRYLISLYDVYKGRRKIIYCPHRFYEMPFRKVRMIDLNSEKMKLLKKFEKKRYVLFCLNDSEETTDAERKVARDFYEGYFPKKSSFEK